MRLAMNQRIGILLLFLGFSSAVCAQQDTIYNTNSPLYKSTERIAYYEQLYRFRVTRFIDLKERQNSGFKSSKADIGGLIIDLINAKKISPYSGAFGDPADFESPMADTAALILNTNFVRSQTRGSWSATESYVAGERVIVPEADAKGIVDDNVFQALQDNSGKEPITNGAYWQDQGPVAVKLDQTAVVGIDLIEDVIFDKRRSRLTYDILAIGVDLADPATGEVQPRFYVRYADVVAQIEKLYRSKNMAERKSVIWANRYNPSENKKFTDAFKLRLFHGVIRKVENPDDLSIMQIIYDKSTGRGSYAEGVFQMWEQEMQMMEKEHNLWEF
jgi:Gliding motility associated protein GldN